MKPIPPLPPGCPLFRVRGYDGKTCFLCSCTLVFCRVSGREEVTEIPVEDLLPSTLWCLIMAGVAEVAWLKEAERIAKEYCHGSVNNQAIRDQLQARENARAWRAWGESK